MSPATGKRGPQYTARQFNAELKWLGIRDSPASVGEPECNGLIERFMRTLKKDSDHVLGRTAGMARTGSRNLGTAICDQKFGGGVISAGIQFDDAGERSMYDLILYYESSTRHFLKAVVEHAGDRQLVPCWWSSHAYRAL